MIQFWLESELNLYPEFLKREQQMMREKTLSEPRQHREIFALLGCCVEHSTLGFYFKTREEARWGNLPVEERS